MTGLVIYFTVAQPHPARHAAVVGDAPGDPMIPTTQRRTLTLEAPEAPGRPAHVSAASGLVRAGDWLYVVADDALHLAVFPADGDAPGHTVRLFPGELPLEHAARKAAKPDLEALCLLRPSAGCAARRAAGAALGLHAGAERRARCCPWRRTGRSAGAPRAVDFTALYAQLDARAGGAQRGGRGGGGHAAAAAQPGQRRPGRGRAGGPGPGPRAARAGGGRAGRRRRCAPCAAGSWAGRRRAAVLHGRRRRCRTGASSSPPPPRTPATRTRMAPVKGSAVGVLAPDGTPLFLDAVDAQVKLEGVDARVEGGRIHLLLVADADDPSVPAPLLEAVLPVPG